MIPLSIAAASGGFKCVFVHGVLSAFEEAGVRAGCYAAASASVLPAAFAATGSARRHGVDYWLKGLDVRLRPGNGMSEMVLAGVNHYGPALCHDLFDGEAPRFLIATSHVLTDEGSRLTQGDRASRLGREILLAMARGDRRWTSEHLRTTLFDSRSSNPELLLTPENFNDAAYASTRMLHAWRVPATVNGEPHIDASYTCSCPAEETAAITVGDVIAIGNEVGPLHHDLFNDRTIGTDMNGTWIEAITPGRDLAEMGVEFTRATADGLREVYRYGIDTGAAWLAGRSLPLN